MDAAAAMPLRPAAPRAPDAVLPMRPFLKAIRTNTLTIWPKAAYREDSSVQSLMGRAFFLLNKPEAIHHVLVANHANYRRSPASIRILRPITGEGLLLAQGDAWKLQRRTVAPALAPRVMAMLARHIAISSQGAMDRLAGQVDQPVNLLGFMQGLALDIAGRSMFSLEMDRYGSAMRAMLVEYGDRYSRPRLLDLLLPLSIPSPRDLGRFAFKRRWMKLIETILASRLEAPPADVPRDLFDLLRAARDPETGAGFSPTELRDQVATLILAGHETTAVTLFWAVLMLAQAPEAQEWLAEEVRAVEIDPNTAHDTMSGLVRTRAVVNETLRLFPPAFAVARETIKADDAAGVALAPRSVVMIAPWVLHRHVAYWDQPEAFRPGRFMPDQPAPAKFAFMPFGAGPRICVGAQFAMAEAVLALAAVIGRFRVARVDDRPVVPVGIVTTQPDHPAAMALSVRTRPA